ncbi:MAG: hypothetical protein KAT07_12265 [Calditrichia bacterium]|nr:hypothetical protein [Calditrichia bacterium]
MKPLVIIFFIIVIVSCQPNNKQSEVLPEVKEVELSKIDPELFTEEEWYMPYYLKHFARVANSVVDTGSNRGYFDLSVWRGSKNHHTYNARIMEGILSLVWFYTTERPWNEYYNDKALKLRIEAALDFWCKIQHDDGRFSEYRVGQWSLAPTAFATKFTGRALWLLDKGPDIDKDVFERSRMALRKALYIGFTHEELWEHGINFTNQYANLWGGALLYLDVWPDEEINDLFTNRIRQSMTGFQSSVGYFYERGGPDWGYNLSTHHSDLQVTWEFAEGTEFEDLIVNKTRDWYDWFSYNAVKEPDNLIYYLNRAVETRQQKGFYQNTEIEDPAYERWTPQAEFVPEAHAFEMSETEFKNSNHKLYQEMMEKYPEVAPLEPGEFNTFSPYAFLHHGMKMWKPTEKQKSNAIQNLPYLRKENFIHVRQDDRNTTNYTFVRKPGYYAIFNSGKIITKQQRYGLGLVWNPSAGTVFQSQSRTDVAAFGTKASGMQGVYEASDLYPEFIVDGKQWIPEPGKNDLACNEFEVHYALGEKGNKKLLFKEDKIIIQIEHPGKFTELIPLLVGLNDSLTIGENQVKLGNMIINISEASEINTTLFDADLNEKKCNVIEIRASGNLKYEIYFY